MKSEQVMTILSSQSLQKQSCRADLAHGLVSADPLLWQMMINQEKKTMDVVLASPGSSEPLDSSLHFAFCSVLSWGPQNGTKTRGHIIYIGSGPQTPQEGSEEMRWEREGKD